MDNVLCLEQQRSVDHLVLKDESSLRRQEIHIWLRAPFKSHKGRGKGRFGDLSSLLVLVEGLDQLCCPFNEFW